MMNDEPKIRHQNSVVFRKDLHYDYEIIGFGYLFFLGFFLSFNIPRTREFELAKGGKKCGTQS